MKKLILATHNQHKIVEMKHVLSGLKIEILTSDSFPEIIEDGLTLEANAEKKARSIYEATGIISLADDTGLEVDFLNGKPGVFSSRYAGINTTYEQNNKKLLSELDNVPFEQRNAKFRCVMAIVNNGNLELLEGQCHGYILNETRGKNGFGYDPLFYVPEYNQTFAEMSLELKNEISHRGIALRKVKNYFEKIT